MYWRIYASFGLDYLSARINVSYKHHRNESLARILRQSYLQFNLMPFQTILLYTRIINCKKTQTPVYGTKNWRRSQGLRDGSRYMFRNNHPVLKLSTCQGRNQTRLFFYGFATQKHNPFCIKILKSRVMIENQLRLLKCTCEFNPPHQNSPRSPYSWCPSLRFTGCERR